eukprot:CAMPEP_0177627098 /NCGR_PEP_ID=MMETSP0419_2-20121207/31021_1 /TAXON_ID=582737 /ORGANISM="Tetraselmis sp., Strain GSL018" /LENGTH=250 /DNA_ID=CAMNT_0019128227 /DNA_START=298 /DNA_END=1048 /DNA_ORIENTATION=+
MKNSKVSSGGRPQSAGSRQLEQSTGAGTDDLAALEASGVLGELREATLSLLERRPDDPMLFLCSYFNDRMACNSAIPGRSATPARGAPQTPGSWTASLLHTSSGVRGDQANRLMTMMVGPGWPQTSEHCLKVHPLSSGDFVSFSNFGNIVRLGLLVRELQRHAAAAADEIFYRDKQGILKLPRHVFNSVLEQIQGAIRPTPNRSGAAQFWLPLPTPRRPKDEGGSLKAHGQSSCWDAPLDRCSMSRGDFP